MKKISVFLVMMPSAALADPGHLLGGGHDHLVAAAAAAAALAAALWGATRGRPKDKADEQDEPEAEPQNG